MAGEKPSSTFKLQVNDRVKRTDSPGCYGTVKDIRHEVTATSGESKDKGLLITVLWDNGTFSYFGPEGVQALTEK